MIILPENLNIYKTQVDPLELKNTVTRIKNSVNGLVTAEERICEVKDRSMENKKLNQK